MSCPLAVCPPYLPLSFASHLRYKGLTKGSTVPGLSTESLMERSILPAKAGSLSLACRQPTANAVEWQGPRNLRRIDERPHTNVQCCIHIRIGCVAALCTDKKIKTA